MTRVALFGATGSLGSHVARLAAAAGHDVSVRVRVPARLPPDIASRVIPKVRDTYWPHRVNFERLQRSTIEWRLLCPGPMVDQPAVGIHRLRVSLERLPVAMPAVEKLLPNPLLLPRFAKIIPQKIIPYADAAAFMLANLDRGGPMTRKRVGLALPHGMTGRKEYD